MIGFQALQMKEDDSMDAFIAKLNGYATKAKELGKTLDQSLLVRKLLDSMPDRFIQIVASIEQNSDLDEVSLDEIIGKLKAYEERIQLRKGGRGESQENLLFAHGETLEKEDDLVIADEVDQTFQEETGKATKINTTRKRKAQLTKQE